LFFESLLSCAFDSREPRQGKQGRHNFFRARPREIWDVPFVFVASPRVSGKGETEMRYKITLALILAALFSVTALAETRSDYDRIYDFSKLRTWDFKAVSRIPNDPIALVLSTTTEHLAQRLGPALEKAYDGQLEYDFSHENKLARVTWQRD